MNKDQRKTYNKTYYEKNKETILSKACAKVECEFCKRTIINNNLLKHQTLPICQRKANLLKQINERKENINNNLNS